MPAPIERLGIAFAFPPPPDAGGRALKLDTIARARTRLASARSQKAPRGEAGDRCAPPAGRRLSPGRPLK